jgi:hypothetical protein
MPDEPWRPLWARKSEKQTEYDALAEGVPPWLVQALVDWLDEHLLTEESYDERRPVRESLQAIEVMLRIPLEWDSSLDWTHQSLLAICKADGDKFLSVVDWGLNVLGRPGTNHEDAIKHLERVLVAGGSAWTVSPSRNRLVRRAQEEAAAAARQLIEGGSRAGRYLAEAWHHMYGRDPHPGSAYREAVRAVEAAASPVVIPNSPRATLGTVIKALKDAPPGKFVTVFSDNSPAVDPMTAIRGLMDLVWTNQLDRHGTADADVPLHVSREQAEAALHATVTLVQWFERGVVRLTVSAGRA